MRKELIVVSLFVCSLVGCDSGDKNAAADDCDTLATCCETIQASVKAACDSVVAQGDAASCAQNFSNWKTVGYCVDDAGPDPDASADQDVTPDASTGGACEALKACCENVADDQKTMCLVLAQQGNESACASTLYCQ